ncbi:MAG TPA: hypothetical protein VEH48_00295 [Candidatus Nitrosopolaris sp.]|nr:hypothetical protein [Candidatus Nitrosopolaris sp.]
MRRDALLFIGIFILVILGFLLIITSGHGKKPAAPKTTAPAVLALPDYATTDATTSMTIDGTINGDELHRAIRITIGNDSRELQIIQGYSGHVLSTQSFYDTQDAYGVFLRAINNTGFLTKLKNSTAPSDERGQCPQGNRYIFELDQNGTTLSRLWASDCGAAVGTLGGNSSLLQSIFELQIPGYQNLVQNVNLAASQ